MPAPKGNKFAAKDNPKIRSVAFRFRPEVVAMIKKIAISEKISMTQILEKALLTAYPEKFDNLF